MLCLLLGNKEESSAVRTTSLSVRTAGQDSSSAKTSLLLRSARITIGRKGTRVQGVSFQMLNILVAPVAYQVILEPGIGQFREFEPRRVHIRINSLGLFLVHKLT